MICKLNYMISNLYYMMFKLHVVYKLYFYVLILLYDIYNILCDVYIDFIFLWEEGMEGRTGSSLVYPITL